MSGGLLPDLNPSWLLPPDLRSSLQTRVDPDLRYSLPARATRRTIICKQADYNSCLQLSLPVTTISPHPTLTYLPDVTRIGGDGGGGDGR